MARPFIARLPSSEAMRSIPVRVVAIDRPLARWWHDNVQPHIDQAPPPRADRGWNWAHILPFVRSVARTIGQQPSFWALALERPAGDIVPIGMMAMIDTWPALDAVYRTSAFVWYLSTAPASIVAAQLDGAARPKLVGRATLDIALVESERRGQEGRVGLHAAKAGGDALLDWYSAQGMQRLPASTRLPFGLRSVFAPNDGRYFFYHPEGACSAMDELDRWRRRGQDVESRLP